MPLPPMEFFRDASKKSIEDLELGALNRSANLAKAIRVELEAWVDEMATAKFARLILDNWEDLSRPVIEPKKAELLPAPGERRRA
jgi:hypothetical protein